MKHSFSLLCVPSLLLVPLLLYVLLPAAFGDEPTQKLAAKPLQVEGLWVTKLGKKKEESIRISRDGTKYLIEFFSKKIHPQRSLAHRDGDVLKTGLMDGNIIFSDDGKRTYYGGREFWKLPDHKVREFVEHQEAAKIRRICMMHVRKCQEVMRKHQNLKQLVTGDRFTREDLEEYMVFPANIKIEGGLISFKPSDKIPPQTGDNPVDDAHLWLKIVAPDTHGNVGKFGFKDIQDTADW